MPIQIIVQAASGTSLWTIVATFSAVVAAVAALVTVIYARRTVRDGKSAHAEEMNARTDALVAEIRLQRLVHASRIADVLTAIARATYDDAVNPPVPGANSQPPSMIPSLQAQLRAQLAVFYALDGPELKSSDALAANLYGDVADAPYETARPDAIRKMVGKGLEEMERIAEHDKRLNLTLNETLRLTDLAVPADEASRRSAWARFCRWLGVG